MDARRRVRTARPWGVVALTLLAAPTAACGVDDSVGFGTPTVRALDEVGLAQHFTGPPSELVGELRVLPDGCVVALVDGAQHVVVWPEGSEVEDDGDGTSVRLPSTTVLEADSTRGDTFGAVGVIDDAGLAPIDEDPATSDGYLGSYLGFCDVDGPPLVIHDAGTVVVRTG